MRGVDGMRFAGIKSEVFNKVMDVEIDEVFISNESIRQIVNILELEGKDEDELRSIRNTIVRIIADMEEQAISCKDERLFRELSTKMSGITCVIDNMIWKIGGEV